MPKLPWHPADFDPSPEELRDRRAKEKRLQDKERLSKVFSSTTDPSTLACTCGKCTVVSEYTTSYCCASLFHPSATLLKHGKELRDLLVPFRGSGTKCVAEASSFTETYLNPAVARAATKMYQIYEQPHIDRRQMQNRTLRYGVYRYLAADAWSTTGYNVRIEFPSCVMAAVRAAFPDPEGQYTGFYEKHALP